MLAGTFLSFGKEKSPAFVRDKNKRYILLIEDDPDISEMYKTKLEAEGFIVLTLEDGKITLKTIRDTLPDLVLLDILMPGKDGFDVLEEKNRCKVEKIKNIPVIVLSNLASPIDIEEGKSLGVKDWWLKAYNTPPELVKKVKKFLSESQNPPAKIYKKKLKLSFNCLISARCSVKDLLNLPVSSPNFV